MPLTRFVVEGFAGGGFCVEAWSGGSVLVGGEGAGCEKQAQAEGEVCAKAHGGEIIAQRNRESAYFFRFFMPKRLSGIAAQSQES